MLRPKKSANLFALTIALLLMNLLFARQIETSGRILSGHGQQSQSAYAAPVRLADLENQSINESSGIAASGRDKNIFWTHNDSGDGPFLYAFDRQGKDRGVWRVTGASALDWEDMAIGPGPRRGQPYIYAGDIGDNSRKRDEIVVYRVIEPAVAPKDASSTRRTPINTEPADVIRLKYPDGKHDAETLLVHPSTGDIYIVTKVRGSAAGVYKAKAPLPRSRPFALTRVGEVRFPNIFVGYITGGDISPDGRSVALCDYFGACEMTLPAGRARDFDEIWKQPLIQISLGPRRQGESICYRADGKALLATSEGLPCPLIEVTRSN